MGEWSDYFEDFPEENPANWVNGKFDPQLREQLNREAAQQAVANLEVRQLIMNAKRDRKAKALFDTAVCPQCGEHKLNSYRISETFYLCECQECGIYGAGATHDDAVAKTADSIGEGLDWRDGSLY
ncbi:MAG: hypothetical protein JSR42_12015 [Proteobacteria bacterium]|nr:hypothetical protein [Pseudomonadota bacterium]